MVIGIARNRGCNFNREVREDLPENLMLECKEQEEVRKQAMELGLQVQRPKAVNYLECSRSRIVVGGKWTK